MGKIGLVCLYLFAVVVCGYSASVGFLSSEESPTEVGNVGDFQLERKMRELEQFHEEFKDFKSSVVELSSAFLRFRQSILLLNGSSPVSERTGKSETTLTGAIQTRATTRKPDSPGITSCSDAMGILPTPRSNLQTIHPYGNGDSRNLQVLCDFETEGGGWTVIQKRSSGPALEFNQNWAEYQNGFGSLDGNFWLGLDNIHALTKNGDQELRIQLEDFQGNKAYAEYSSFSVSDASDFYRLSISGFSNDSTAGDSMTDGDGHRDFRLNGMRFTTLDRDNDNFSSGNCAGVYGGGWWFNDCSTAQLHGTYREKGEAGRGIMWHSWKGWDTSLAKTEIKIRKRK